MLLKNIFILGDIGYFGKNLQMVVNQVQKMIMPKDVVTILGDNFYPYGVNGKDDPLWNNYHEIFKDLSNPKYSILGNHDYLSNPTCQIRNEHWIMDDWYFKKEFQNIDLYFLDTNQFLIHDWVSEEKIEEVHQIDVTTLIYNQIDWLDNEMKKNKNKNKIVFGHYPLISNGVYKTKMEKLYDYLYECFKRNNVNLYISGHEHNIQFIKRYDDHHTFNQVIIGSTSEYRHWENNYCTEDDMFDSSDNFFGKLSIHYNFVIIEYFNKGGKLKYKYKVNL